MTPLTFEWSRMYFDRMNHLISNCRPTSLGTNIYRSHCAFSVIYNYCWVTGTSHPRVQRHSLNCRGLYLDLLTSEECFGGFFTNEYEQACVCLCVIGLNREQIETNMDFLGLIIMQNKIKEQTAGVLLDLRQANIRTLMVTGKALFRGLSHGGYVFKCQLNERAPCCLPSRLCAVRWQHVDSNIGGSRLRNDSRPRESHHCRRRAS